MKWSERSFVWLFPAVCVFGRLLLQVFGPFRAVDRRRVPRAGGLLILANHISDLDPVVVQAACPRHIHFMAKSELFEMRVLGRVIRWFRAFPVRRGEPDKAAIRRAVELLKSGQAVCVFPEGRLSEDGRLQPILPGVALIARMAEARVICCGVRGTQRVIPYGQMAPRPALSWVSAHWGEPFDVERDAEAFLVRVNDELRRLSGQ